MAVYTVTSLHSHACKWCEVRFATELSQQMEGYSQQGPVKVQPDQKGHIERKMFRINKNSI